MSGYIPKLEGFFFLNKMSSDILFSVVMFKKATLCFSDSLVEKTIKHQDSIWNFSIDTQLVHKLFENSLFVSANTYKKCIVSKQNCTAHHDDKVCFPPNSRYLKILVGDIKELLQKRDEFVSTTNTWNVCTNF